MKLRSRARRFDPLPPLVIVLVLGVAIFYAGLTRAPEWEVYERAESWRVVGPWVASIRARYLPPDFPVADPLRGRSNGSVSDAIRDRAPRETLAEREAGTQAPRLFLQPGVDLREEARPSSALLHRTRQIDEYQVLERTGDWARIRSTMTGLEAWVDLAKPRDETPPLGMEPAPPGPLAARSADPQRLAKALAIIGPDSVTRRRVAGYDLVAAGLDPKRRRDADLLTAIQRALEGIEPTYVERWGLEPVGEPAETLVLFAAEEDYREFQSEEPRLAGLQSEGHTAGGLVATFTAGRSPSETLMTVVHEVAHLLNRRAIGPALPPWLDEGIAEEVSLFAFDPQGLATTESWRATVVGGGGANPGAPSGDAERDRLIQHYRSVRGDFVELSGPLANLQRLRGLIDAGQLDSLKELVDREWEGFVSGVGASNYAYASLWARYLVVAPDRRQAFHAFLRDVAAGLDPSGERLLSHLQADWRTLDRAFRSWIRAEALQLGL